MHMMESTQACGQAKAWHPGFCPRAALDAQVLPPTRLWAWPRGTRSSLDRFQVYCQSVCRGCRPGVIPRVLVTAEAWSIRERGPQS